MKIHMERQGSAEWLSLRLGVITASEAHELVTREYKVKTGEAVQKYMDKKIAEKIMGFSGGGSSWSMDQGTLLESEALPWLNFAHGIKGEQVGFCMTDDLRCGASPDALIGEDSGLEIKSPQPPTMVRYLLDGVVPKAHRLQVQFSMFVTNRATWHFLAYSRYLPKLLIKVERDPVAQEAIGKAVTTFLADYDAAFARISALMPQSNGRE